MSALAPTLEIYFTERLVHQLQASPNTVSAYRDARRLLLGFASKRTGKAPSQLDIADLDAPLIGAFLEHLETERHNTVRTRNARLAAIRSFFRFAAFRHPEHASLIARVLDIPNKRYDKAIVTYLTEPEAQALIVSPDRSTWTGRRDSAMMELDLQTGLRVSELAGLCNKDVELPTGAYLHCWGKGRKERCTPLTKDSVTTLKAWMRERGGRPDDPLFPSRRGTPLGRDAIEALVTKHAASAARRQPSLHKKRVTPHVLRHSCAMALRRQGVDRSVIALWLVAFSGVRSVRCGL
jgi:integrase/recombinase XerD